MSSETSTRRRIKEILVESLNLEGMTPESIGDDTKLWGDDGLGLDSVDALELMVSLEQEYGVRIDDSQIEPESLATVVRLEEFINKLRASKSEVSA